MRKELIISTVPQETRVALLEDDELVEFMIERHRAQGIVGNIYKGRVTKVLPGMQSAFVDIGLERDAFLYVSDFVEDGAEYERIVSEAEAEALEESPSGSGSRTRSRAQRSGRRRGGESAEPAGGKEAREARETREAKEAGRGRTSARAAAGSEADEAEAGSEAGKAEARSEAGRAEARSEAGKAEGRFGVAGEERPASERRTERRPRRGRIPTFEAREEREELPSGSLQVLPGETLAKYRSEPPAAPGPEAEEESAGAEAPEEASPDDRPDRTPESSAGAVDSDSTESDSAESSDAETGDEGSVSP